MGRKRYKPAKVVNHREIEWPTYFPALSPANILQNAVVSDNTEQAKDFLSWLDLIFVENNRAQTNFEHRIGKKCGFLSHHIITWQNKVSKETIVQTYNEVVIDLINEGKYAP
jgi:hypothetical protein